MPCHLPDPIDLPVIMAVSDQFTHLRIDQRYDTSLSGGAESHNFQAIKKARQ